MWSARALAALMAVQAGLGLLRPSAYRDAEWIRAAWYANDWVTLVIVVPLLVASERVARTEPVRGALLSCGCLGYAVYNYAYYMLGASLNVFFPIYLASLLLAGTLLGGSLRRMDVSSVAASFSTTVPVRLIGGYFVLLAASLAIVWLAMWAAYAFFDRPTPVEPDAFRLVASLDLTIMVPAMSIGGALLWRHRPWGFLLIPIAGIQSTLYLVVLTAASIVAIARGLVEPPGEVPVWGSLALLTAAATWRLVRGVRAPTS